MENRAKPKKSDEKVLDKLQQAAENFKSIISLLGRFFAFTGAHNSRDNNGKCPKNTIISGSGN